MTDGDRSFAGSIPALYDRYLGPLIFEPYAVDIAGRVAKLSPKNVLETAAGTGIVTGELAKQLAPEAKILATDLNPAMLEVAAKKVKAPNVAWQQADATALSFKDASFDAVVCQFGAMFFPDKVTGYREAHRVLRPGGYFIFNVWDRIELNGITETVSDTVAACFPGNPPQFLRRTPHGYFDVAAIRNALAQAGFDKVTVEHVAKRGRANNHRDPAIGFCQGSPLRSEIEARDPKQLEPVTEAASEALARRFGRGAIEGGIQAIVITAAR
ncbi:MAG TPA: class I SAM-dependent methyltransferase [Aestuariivirga sp.]|nr:class I SAM-dependent methyltransferase [Aestuariivirga sp.]